MSTRRLSHLPPSITVCAAAAAVAALLAVVAPRSACAQVVVAQTNKFTALDAATLDSFGISVSLSGNIALVGASADDIGSNAGQGSAYLFNAATGQQIFKLIANDGAPDDNFGTSVSLSGNVALVGAPEDDIGSNLAQGSAYLFNVSTGQQLFKLTVNGGVNGDRLGASVALSGDLALVGAKQADTTLGGNQGVAYLFNATTGQQIFRLTASDGGRFDEFGTSVALSGNLALVGSVFDDSGSDMFEDRGSAYLFNVTTGQQLFKLTANDAAAGDWFGGSVALSGNLALVGATQEENGSRGAAYLFNALTGQQLAKLTANDGNANDEFGYSVALSGNFALIGAHSDNVGNGFGQGSAYLFDISNPAAPVQVAKFFAADGVSADVFGASVSLTGQNALVGARFDTIASTTGDDHQGSAYMFSIQAPVNSAAPEPVTIALVLPAALAMMARKRRKHDRGPEGSIRFSTRTGKGDRGGDLDDSFPSHRSRNTRYPVASISCRIGSGKISRRRDGEIRRETL